MLLEIPLGRVFKQERWFLEKLLYIKINSTQYLSVSENFKSLWKLSRDRQVPQVLFTIKKIPSTPHFPFSVIHKEPPYRSTTYVV